MRAAWLALAACAGCNSILGLGDVHLGPGDGPPGDGMGIDAPSPDVTGVSMITWYKSDGTTAVTPEDMTGYTIGVYSLDGSTHIPGIGGSDGTFVIHDVPQGPYLLELTRPDSMYPQLYVGSARALDAGWATIGRPDAVSSTTATPITLDVVNMTPFNDFDKLWADSYGVGTEFELFDQAPSSSVTNAPSPGNTILSASFDWHDGYTYDASGAASRLVQSAAGDDFYIVHTTSVVGSDVEGAPAVLSRLADIFESSAVTMIDGGSASVSGTFAPVAATHTQSVSFNLLAYRSAMGDAGHFVSDDYDCFRLTNYASMHDGRIGADTWDAGGTVPPQQFTVTYTNSPYGDPFPTSWPSLFDCSLSHVRLYVLPDGTLTGLGAALGADVAGSDVMTFDTPAVTAATSVTVDGMPFLEGGTVPFDGTSPVTVAWAGPSVGEYFVYILDNHLDDSLSLSGVLVTYGTSMEIPSALLREGDFYALEIVAVNQDNAMDFASGELRLQPFPTGNADLLSGLFRFSSTCGNGVVGSDEQCDAGGSDSASCDADCTTAMCGDGYVNTAAGEQCDNAGDSATCDGDCTAASCGDGYVNAAAGEQCDDGNANPGDGCSASCQIEAGYTCTGMPSVCTN